MASSLDLQLEAKPIMQKCIICQNINDNKGDKNLRNIENGRLKIMVFQIFKRWINQPVNWKWSPVFKISHENMLPKVRLFMKYLIGIYRNYLFTSI